MIPRLHTPIVSVELGDTLSGIALYWYGESGRAIDIFEANRFVLEDPESLPVGEALRLPMIDAELPPLS